MYLAVRQNNTLKIVKEQELKISNKIFTVKILDYELYDISDDKTVVDSDSDCDTVLDE